jgi:hypothetical protein
LDALVTDSLSETRAVNVALGERLAFMVNSPMKLLMNATVFIRGCSFPMHFVAVIKEYQFGYCAAHRDVAGV